MKQSSYKIKSIPSLLPPHWGLGGFLLCLFPLWLSAQTPGKNYIVTTVPFQAVSDPTTLVDANSNTAIQYFDGLGRPIQTVQRGITPSGADLVTGIMYDSYGRDSLKWLPAVAGGNNGAYYPNFADQAVSSNGDSKPYSRTEYEPSPLNRVTGQYGAGADWYAAGKKQSIEYLTNDANIACYYVNSDKHLAKDVNYAAGSLYVTKATDEDGKVGYEFKDKLGRVILKRQMLGGDNVDTYYVYNDLGKLCYVLPPKAVDELTDLSDDNTVMKQYCYLYQYDARGNCIYKKLPGCTPIYMVYDKADRMVLSQDGNQRKKLQNQLALWTVTKYDVFGRVLFTGLMYRSEMDSTDNYKSIRDVISNDVVTESYTGFATATPLTINYYDSYSFIPAGNHLNYDNSQEQNGYTPKHSNAIGLLTGTRVYHLDNSGLYETSAMYYDKYGRVVQSRATNHLGGYDLVYNALDFTGKPTKALKTHGINGTTPSISELYSYIYDKAQRLTATTYSLNGGSSVILASNVYDELGRLITKKRHISTDTESHAYNVRGWPTNNTSGSFEENLYYNVGLPSGVTPCYNGNIAMNTWTYNGAVKKYGYAYDALNRLTTSTLYDANNQSSTSFAETFTFDKMGNVTSLGRTGSSTQIDGLTLTYNGNQLKQVDDANGSRNLYDIKEYTNRNSIGDDFAYDVNGNMIKDLDRDIATIKYNVLNLPDVVQFKNGNQIKNTYNAGGQKLGTEYFTWVPGANAPVVITGDVLNLSYLQNSVDQNGTAYIGNVEYNTKNGNSSLTAVNRLYNAEGYVENPSNPQYYYYRRDHLGDNREVWLANTGETVQRTQYYPSGLPWAYNSGDNPGKQQRKYNGKEFVEMHGYDTYDYGWRGYYSALGSFTSRDPLAEKYYSISPYIYCHNNPVNVIDPKGLTDVFRSNGTFIKSDGVDNGNILVQIGTKSYPLSSLDYNKQGTAHAVSKIIGHYASEMGYSGTYGIKGMDSGGHTTKTGSVFLSAFEFINGSYDSKYNIKSVLGHEEGHKLESSGVKGDYKFMDHAKVYFDQGKTSDFTKSTLENQYTVALSFTERVWSAYYKGEITEEQVKTNISDFNENNTGGITINAPINNQNGIMTIYINIDGASPASPQNAKVIDKPEK